MKIQSLAVIFVIIILPISILLSEYLQAQIDTLNLQTSYDSKLIGATYDAIKAYQINATNSTTRELTSTKIRDVEASANTFLTSIANNFGESGSGKSTIQSYVPAIVYCLYDGYYIYTPYTNNLSNIYDTEEKANSADYKDGETLYGVKPYIYYSCRYKPSAGNDFVITYSLDNFITIQGIVNGTYWNKSGYFLDGAASDGSYDGIPVAASETLTENIYDSEYDAVKNYRYAKVDGTKYYIDDNGNVFYIQQDGEKNYSPNQTDREYYRNKIMTNTSAHDFYTNAYNFTNEVKSALSTLKFSDSFNIEGNRDDLSQRHGFDTDTTIFKEDSSKTKAEDTNSNFTEHRTAVIRYAIEKNLTTAIANYNNNFAANSAAFAMPNLTETDWYKIINNISVITFLQGLPIGGKIYNGYAVVNNNKNDDYVSKDSIYIVANGEYHRFNDSDLKDKSGYLGILNTAFERHTTNETNYYYPRSESGCYTSIVNQNTVQDYDENNLTGYLTDLGGTNLASTYYTALGREKAGMYRSANIAQIVDNRQTNTNNP